MITENKQTLLIPHYPKPWCRYCGNTVAVETKGSCEYHICECGREAMITNVRGLNIFTWISHCHGCGKKLKQHQKNGLFICGECIADLKRQFSFMNRISAQLIKRHEQVTPSHPLKRGAFR